ncbi:MAG TPA: DNA helicase II [Gammaproteobacteria bacterium]|nr:DNA helicase II [Gammaproteobacteria bacterium]
MTDTSPLLRDLNLPQRNAVSAPLGHARILAGAGSGKTRVLVHRIAWLIAHHAIPASHILAVTFTNKAASEMRHRIEHLLGYSATHLWVGTFHGLAHRLLRRHWEAAQLPQNFQIIDSDDQQRMIKRLLRAMNIDDAQWPAKQVQWYINHQKDEGLRASHIQTPADPYHQTLLTIYQAYEQACQQNGLIDFAEILLRCHEMWRNHPALLTEYQQRFQHILVDEFQDTNTIQYAWLRQLTGKEGHLFIVGDDDQAIYGWRGAKIENIQQFHHDYPSAYAVNLEQNYRSTGHILAAANAVIANNRERLGKSLWTDGDNGDPIQLYQAFNERDEANYIVNQIQSRVKQGEKRGDHAVLYRSNAQSRAIEEALLQANMPYRVYGGLRFFERAEIKDILAYLRLIAHRNDDSAFERIVNTPTRGIGAATLAELRQYSRQHQLSLWQTAITLIEQNAFTSRANNALQAFITLIDSLDPTVELTLNALSELVITETGLRQHYLKDKSEKGQSRVDNLDEFVSAAKQFQRPQEAEAPSLLDAFLAHAALEAGDNQAGEWEDCVQLMTLHSAKGLEFPTVFIPGLEEGLFPGKRSSDEPQKLAEERRLCYVGMTRARQQLYLLYTESRFLYGQEAAATASRFLAEIPDACLQHIRARQHTQRHITDEPVAKTTQIINNCPFHLGDNVQHPKFGIGTVIDIEGQNKHTRIHINFEQVGAKWLVLSYAKLERI